MSISGDNLHNLFSHCEICPRSCGAARAEGGAGYCGADLRMRIARAALHMWEEPCISGERGSGAVFFTGCNLGCVFCQNYEISHGGASAKSDDSCRASDDFLAGISRPGRYVTSSELADIFLDLESQGAHNINCVTATHFLPAVCESIDIARGRGLTIPALYNCGGYESARMIAAYGGRFDIFMPDMKYISENLSGMLSAAPDYPAAAKASIDEMVRLRPEPVFDESGLMRSGVIVRHLILPGHTREAIAVLEYLASKYGNSIYISLLGQYTPAGIFANQNQTSGDATYPGGDASSTGGDADSCQLIHTEIGVSSRLRHLPPREISNLSRRLTQREYDKVVDAAIRLGLKNVYIQDPSGSSSAAYIPDFHQFD